MTEMIPLALCFLKGDSFDFVSYFLGHVYKVGSDCQEKRFDTSILWRANLVFSIVASGLFSRVWHLSLSTSSNPW